MSKIAFLFPGQDHNLSAWEKSFMSRCLLQSVCLMKPMKRWKQNSARLFLRGC